MRFTVRFTNGVWHLFDNKFYEAVRAFGLYKAAVRTAETFNARRVPR